jgi:hypothetical protein
MAKPKAKPKPGPAWRNRIIAHEERDPAELKANPKNWRNHPEVQQSTLDGLLGSVGIVQAVVFNKRTGHLVDGHLRVELALKQKQATVPVTVVDLSEEEERLILASLDPIGAMAEANGEALMDLLAGVETADDALAALLGSIAMPFQEPDDVTKEWVGMPEFRQEKLAWRTIKVHFLDQDAVDDFMRRMGQQASEKVNYMWHPRQERMAKDAEK